MADIALYLLIAVAVLFLSIWVTWGFYLAAMALKRRQQSGEMTTTEKVFGYPLLYTMLVIDALFNLFIGTILFFEPPKGWLFSYRAERHLKSKGYRRRAAKWFCSRFLDPYDPDGKHCGD